MQVKRKLTALVKSTYPHNFPLVLFAVLGLASTRLVTVENLIFVVVVAWAPMAAGFVINVIGDWYGDDENKKNREVHQSLSKRELLCLYVVLVLFSFLLSITGNWQLKILIFAEILLGIVYSIGPRLKNIMILNYVVLALIYGLVPPLIGIYAVTEVINNTQVMVISLISIFSFLSSQIKDFEDVAGDKPCSTIAQFGQFGKHLYILYHILFFSLLVSLIVTRILPRQFTVTLLSLPLFTIMLIRFNKADTKKEYRKLHLLDNFLALVLIALFAVAFLL